jgi:tetratricopeptide (TPR) repeat protein
LAVTLIITFLISSCATAPVEEKPPEKPKLSIEEQEEKSLESYNEILEMTANVRRSTILPQLKEQYLKLIEEYPDAYFAEESYLRLIIMSFEDSAPPNIEEAEKYYREYLEKYPDPRLNAVINDTMARNYYKYGHWERLANFLTPHIERYVNTGELPKPFYLFIYCESLFNLGEYVEAKKGSLTLIRLFPDSYEAKLSKNKINKIDNIKKGTREAE